MYKHFERENIQCILELKLRASLFNILENTDFKGG